MLTWKRIIHVVRNLSPLSTKRRNHDLLSADHTEPLFDPNNLTEDRQVRTIKDKELCLRTALQEDQLCLHYQPQYDIHNGTLRGFEALLRWNHPELGLITPMEFLPLAEETRLIIPIGEWVLQHACKTLQHLAPSPSNLSISVNISATQLVDEQFVEQVQIILERTNLPPCRLELEITQKTILCSDTIVKNQIFRLRQLGIQLALEDYGQDTTISHECLEFPVHTIKIYKSFASDISKPYDEYAINALFKRIRQSAYKIVVEGIESYDQLSQLRKLDFDYAQGYLFSFPLSEDKLHTLLQSLESDIVPSLKQE